MALEEIEDLYSQLFDQSIEIYDKPGEPGCSRAHEPALDLSIQTVTHDPLRRISRKPGEIPLLSRRRDPNWQAHRSRGTARQDRMIQSTCGWSSPSPRTITPKTWTCSTSSRRATPVSSAPWRSSTTARAISFHYATCVDPAGHHEPSQPGPATSASLCT